jgi:hypothetical protein
LDEQIRFITHKGCRVLLIDLSNCSPSDVMQICKLVPGHISSEPPGSVLLLADFTGAQFDRKAITSLKEATVMVRPHLKRSAWVGVETLPHVFYENIKSFSQRDLPTFLSRDQAMAWLVQHGP